MKVHDLRPWLCWGFLMWHGYAFEAIYVALGTALSASLLGILVYH